MSLHLEVGTEPVAGYRLVRAIGQGGFGQVWEAEAPGGFAVALKFIRTDGNKAKPERRALDVVRAIRHPNLLDTQFAVQIDDYLVIAMPLCDRSLMDRLRECQTHGQTGVPFDELIAYMEETARAIDYLNAHRHPSEDGKLISVQHRDIKPHNLFLVGGAVRLADFGLAKIVEDSVTSHTGSMTPHYAAPEMFLGKVSSRSDQYSLAVTYCQLRTGRLPFEGSLHHVMYAHLHNAPELAHVPEEEHPAIARALSKEPANRWPSCQSFVQCLKARVLSSVATGAGRNLNIGDLGDPGLADHNPDRPSNRVEPGFDTGKHDGDSTHSGRPTKPTGRPTEPLASSRSSWLVLVAAVLIVVAGASAATYYVIGSQLDPSKPTTQNPTGGSSPQRTDTGGQASDPKTAAEVERLTRLLTEQKDKLSKLEADYRTLQAQGLGKNDAQRMLSDMLETAKTDLAKTTESLRLAREEADRKSKELSTAQGEAARAKDDVDKARRARDEALIAADKEAAARQKAQQETTQSDLARARAEIERDRAEEKFRQRVADLKKFKAVVAFHNHKDKPAIKYKLRWMAPEGTWTEWESVEIPPDWNKWHYFIGGTDVEVEFDCVGGDEDYTAKRYYLNFNRVPTATEVTAEHGVYYNWEYKTATDLDLVRQK